MLALRPQGDLDRLLADLPQQSHYVTEYLVTEIVSQMPEAIQDFLLKTSILDRFCGPLCDYVVALDEPECDGQAYLEWLDEGNLRSLNTGRASGVIKLAAEKAGWGRKMPAGSGLGLSFYFSHAGRTDVSD